MHDETKDDFHGILLDEKIVGIWFLATTEEQDWLAALREVVPDAKYELTYRFRYYKDDKAFESEDTKNWYHGVLSGTRNYCTLSIQSVGKTMERAAIGPLFEILNEDGDLHSFCEKLADAPFAFMRQKGGGQ